MGLGQKTVNTEAKDAVAKAKNVEDNSADDAALAAAQRALDEAKERAAKKAAKLAAEEAAAMAAREAEEALAMVTGDVEEELIVTDEQLNKAKPAATKAVATKTAAAAPALKSTFTGMALASKENALPALDFGTLPRFKASPAGIKGEEGSLGKTCEVTVVSYNNTFAVAPNEDKAPKELCKFSTDGVHLNDGSGLVADHVQFLKEEGYEKASSKRYVELIAILDDAENDHEELGNMVTFSLSPMSVKSFERYRLQASVKLGMNPSLTEEGFARVRITAKPKSFGNKDFVMLDFSAIDK